MSSPATALIWLCWRRARLPLLLVMVAIPFVATLVLTGMHPETETGARQNAVFIIAAIGVWILGPLVASRSQGPINTTPGVGFPMRSEFTYPVSTLSLTLVPFAFSIGLIFAAFVVSVGLLSFSFQLEYPDPMVHFMVLEYLVIVTAIGWSTRNGFELAICWAAIILLFFLGWFVPEFSFDNESSEFVAGDWTSAIRPALLAALAVVLMLIGVKKQRSGENLVLSEHKNSIAMNGRTLTSVFQLIKRPCPTSSGSAALLWQQRQFRGLQVAVGLGMVIGLLVVLLLAATSARGFWDGPLELDDVAGFAIIAFFSAFVAHLASSFGVTFSNGAARIGTFERTLPLTTARMTLIRVGSGMLCVVVAGIAELLAIAVFGSLMLEDFPALWAEFNLAMEGLLEQGISYFVLRVILLACLLYAGTTLWAVFITWFAIKPRAMTIGFSLVMIYLLLLVAGLSIYTEESRFLQSVDTVRDVHRVVLCAAIVISALYLLYVLVRKKIIDGSIAVLLLVAGFILASLQFIDLQVFEALDADASFSATIYLHSLGLLPLAATTLALWTQYRVRHG